MKKIYKVCIALIVSMVFLSCDDEQLFRTVEVAPPSVTAQNWSAKAVDGGGNTIATVSFSEAGRLFRMPAPLNDTTSTAYRNINIQALLNTGDSRTIDSITVETRWIPSFPSNAPQRWIVHQGISILEAERSSSYNFDFNLNLDSWIRDYTCKAFRACIPVMNWQNVGAIFRLNITREDNMMRLKLHLSDGTVVTIAQVQFSLPKTKEGLV